MQKNREQRISRMPMLARQFLFLKATNMKYSSDKKRKIILDNHTHPSKQIEFEELKKLSND